MLMSLDRLLSVASRLNRGSGSSSWVGCLLVIGLVVGAQAARGQEDTTPPSRDGLTVSSPSWTVNGQDIYAIEMQASDAGSGVREMRAYINLRGSNDDNRRGYLFWRRDRQPIGSNNATNPIACSGGGFADKHANTGGGGYITLVDCASSGTDAQRVVTFYVIPHSDFGEFPENDVAMWARDFALNRSGWLNYDLNFSTSSLVSVGSGSTSRATIDFEGLDGNVEADDYESEGVEILGFEALAASTESNGCNGTTRHGSVPAAPGIINVPNGFSSVSFSFSKSPATVGTVEIWSGLNGTGSKLFEGPLQPHASNGQPVGPCLYDVWLPSGLLSFAGKSIVFRESDSDPIFSWTLFDNFQIDVNEARPVIDGGPGRVLEGDSLGLDVSLSLPVPPAQGKTVELILERVGAATLGETLFVDGAAIAVFNDMNWDQPQTLTVKALENNADTANDEVEFRVRKVGGTSMMPLEDENFFLTEFDDDFGFLLNSALHGAWEIQPAWANVILDYDDVPWRSARILVFPADGYRFDRWEASVTGDGFGPNPILCGDPGRPPCGSITLEATAADPEVFEITEVVLDPNGGTAVSLTPIFVQLEEVPLTVQVAGNGTVQVDGVTVSAGQSVDVPIGTTVDVVGFPGSGWIFGNWSSNPSAALQSPNGNTTGVRVDGPTTVNAQFVQGTLQLSVQTDGTPANPSFRSDLAFGETVQIELDVSAGRVVDDCLVLSGLADCARVDNDTVEVTVRTDTTIRVLFRDQAEGRLGVRVIDRDTGNSYGPFYSDSPTLASFTIEQEEAQAGGRGLRLELFREGETALAVDALELSGSQAEGFCLRDKNEQPDPELGTCPLTQQLPVPFDSLPASNEVDVAALFLDFGYPDGFEVEVGERYSTFVYLLDQGSSIADLFEIEVEIVESSSSALVALETYSAGSWQVIPNDGVHILQPFTPFEGAEYRFRIRNPSSTETLTVGDLKIVSDGCSPFAFDVPMTLINENVLGEVSLAPLQSVDFSVLVRSEINQIGHVEGSLCFEYRDSQTILQEYIVELGAVILMQELRPRSAALEIRRLDGSTSTLQPLPTPANLQLVRLPAIRSGEVVAMTLELAHTGGSNSSPLAVDIDPLSGAGFALSSTHLDIAPGGVQNLVVSFAGSTTGTFNETLRIVSNDPLVDEFIFDLEAVVLPSAATLDLEARRNAQTQPGGFDWVDLVDGTPYWFPGQAQGGLYQTMRLAVTPASTNGIVLEEIEVVATHGDPAIYSVTRQPTLPRTLQPGAPAVEFDIFTQAAPSPLEYRGELRLRYREIGSSTSVTTTVPLRAVVIAANMVLYVDDPAVPGVELLAQHGTLTLPIASPGQTVSQQIHLLHNRATIEPLGLSIDPAIGSGFTLTSPSNITVAPGDIATIELQFDRAAEGTYVGQLVVQATGEPAVPQFFQTLRVQVVADSIDPVLPDLPTSPDCVSFRGEVCLVDDTNFTINITPASDTGGSGVNPNGYRFCRSHDTTGWAGCDVMMSTTAGTSFAVTGAHRPEPGVMRAYWVQATDHAGNLSNWSGPFFIENKYFVPAQDTTPPTVPGDTTSANCVATQNGVCYVNDANFTIQVTPASDPGSPSTGVNPNGYRICRSVDVTGFGGCDVNLTLTGGTSIVVSGSHRPPPGSRRAYYFHATDHAGNIGDWNGPLYVETIGPDTQGPNAPGDTTSPNCNSVSGGVCYVSDADFSIHAAAASDPGIGASGVNPNGYQICRSHDTTAFGGCDVSLTTTGTTSLTVSGSHRPDPGKRRAYYFRARDNAGNWGAWNGPLYVETEAPPPDTTAPTAPGNTTSSNCVVTQGGICYVNDANFTIQVSAASDPGANASGVDPGGYRICRSNNVTGFGGCEVDMTLSGGTSMIVSGSHRPPPGARRAYYFRATDNAGNVGPWNGPLYVETIGPDTEGPTAPGNTTSPNCNSVSGGICYVSDANFSIHAAAASDPGIGASGVNPNGYQICRSHDTTAFGGCDVSLTTTGTTSLTVSGSHRPDPGKRRAYYFRARDNAGNWGAWNGPLYVETEAPPPDTQGPTAPGNTTSPNCVSISGGTCYVNDANFTIQVTPASDPGLGASGVNPSGYHICRSNDTTGWGGCAVSLTLNGGTSMTVSGSHRPAPGARRAYYFQAKDHAGNWGAWNGPLYVETLQPAPDTTGPTAPGNTTSPNCTSISGGVCYVNNADFTIQVTPASDPGTNASGVNPNGYQICRSNDTTGWGGCEVNLSLAGPTSILVTGSHRPQPGKRRAYYFRAIDNAGNRGAWNGPLYVQTN